MAKFKDGELEALIPTEIARKYVIDNDITFTDWQKAALFCFYAPRSEKFSWLRSLRDETDNKVLREQITAYLQWEVDAFNALKNNDKHEYIYTVKVKDPEKAPEDIDFEDVSCYDMEIEAFFLDWEPAYEYGKAVDFEFMIEKIKVSTMETVNEIKADEEDDGHYIRKKANDYVSCIHYDKNGEIEQLVCDEIPDDAGDDPMEHGRNFHEGYIEVPNPFNRGDIVRSIRGSCDFIGVVDMTQDEWKKQQENYTRWTKEKPGLYEYYEIRLWVDIVEKDGEIVGDGINPLDLVPYELSDNPEDKELNDLLLCISEFYKGKGSFEEVQYYQEQYRKAKGYDD